MSVTANPNSRGPYQPFQCLICQSRFTRHENLKRHALLHSRPQNEAVLSCEFCAATFSRPDLRNRHMKRKHPEKERRVKKRVYRESSDEDRDGQSVSPPGSGGGLQLEDSQDWTADLSGILNEPRIDHIGDAMDLATLLQPVPISPSPAESGDWTPSPQQISRGCDLFFANVSHFVPFLHEPTFDVTQAPIYLLFAMFSLSYQYGTDSEQDLSERCFHRALSILPKSPVQPHDNITTVQSHLLLQITGMFYLCGPASSRALTLHSSMISLARKSGLMAPLPISPSSTDSLDTLWHAFVASESHKRTLFAIHQIDALWYQFLSIPRSISHLEIKLDLPCPTNHWTASSAAEWAHRQLVNKSGSNSASSNVQYADAVRRFLCQDIPDLAALPAFDPYGAINITQFLISSAREISGWSTMTGMLSIERFGALRESLVTLEPFICPTAATTEQASDRTSTSTSTSESLCTATWQTAMIELQIWSPSHTSGIVEASIDAVLSASTHPFLSPAPEILCEEMTAKAIQPHVDWFLRYLDTTTNAEGEAPWIALYAYKAFLIAWQLVKGGFPGAMSVVGVEDGDALGAVAWARSVFGRRKRWVVGRLICGCLNRLMET